MKMMRNPTHLILSWISFASGLQCPRCVYLTTDETIPDAVKNEVELILQKTQAPECAQNLVARKPEITEETCKDISGQVSRCLYYKGSLTVTVTQGLKPNTNVSFQLHQRGCYNYDQVSLPSDGCYNHNRDSEDTNIIQTLLDKVITTHNYTVAGFEGSRCLCSQPYCPGNMNTSKTEATNIITHATTTTSNTNVDTSNGNDCNHCNSMLLFLAVLVLQSINSML